MQGTNSEIGYSINCSDSGTCKYDEQIVPKTSIYLPTSSEVAVASGAPTLLIHTSQWPHQKETCLNERKVKHTYSKLTPNTRCPDDTPANNIERHTLMEPWQKRIVGPPPPLNLIPDDRYAFSDESIALRKPHPDEGVSGSNFHDVQIFKKGSKSQELKQRLQNVLCKPNYCSLLDVPESAMTLSEACKRAMRWQAQALAFSTEKPGYVIFNRLDKVSSHFISRPDIIAHFVKDTDLKFKLNNREHNRPTLTTEELLHLTKCVIDYRDNIYHDVLNNLKNILITT
ncbi:hypothetical protein [Parendozoicomonas sp. Alg238-R29]|uniref:hypothetical protein n=1 Tax=Parendozoicomonas sp. Alg238-R29 TaxID=2993446 RepID=UPI00248ED92D|nr:hypothetical protein [Parendozoicomonas sp. Alg238-R29]